VEWGRRDSGFSKSGNLESGIYKREVGGSNKGEKDFSMAEEDPNTFRSIALGHPGSDSLW
jgi:hypothetical protein